MLQLLIMEQSLNYITLRSTIGSHELFSVSSAFKGKYSFLPMAEVSDSCSIHDTCKNSVVRRHYISFKWYGPVKLDGVVTEPGILVSQPSTRTEPAGPSWHAKSRLRWEMDFAFWKSTLPTLKPRTYLSGKSAMRTSSLFIGSNL